MNIMAIVIEKIFTLGTIYFLWTFAILPLKLLLQFLYVSNTIIYNICMNAQYDLFHSRVWHSRIEASGMRKDAVLSVTVLSISGTYSLCL